MRVFTASPRYVQGPGALDQLGKLARGLGGRAAVVIDGEVRRMLEARVEGSFASAGMGASLLTMTADVTHAAIAALATQAGQLRADVVIGVGGGKALDTGKGVALKLGLPFVSVPTIASNDAPASSVIAVYDESHRLIEVLQMPRGPELVVVDSAVIAAAPPRFLRAGIGDAIAKTFEAQACRAAGGNTLRGTPPSHAGLAVAESCYRLLRRHALAALAHVAVNRVSEDVEAVLEATILLSALGFENGGLSVAHAFARGLSGLPEAAAVLHGEHVAYGLLVQLVLEHRSGEFMGDIRDFYRAAGLPLCLADIGFGRSSGHHSGDHFAAVAQAALQGPNIRHFPRSLSASDLEEAMRAVEGLLVESSMEH